MGAKHVMVYKVRVPAQIPDGHGWEPFAMFQEGASGVQAVLPCLTVFQGMPHPAVGSKQMAFVLFIEEDGVQVGYAFGWEDSAGFAPKTQYWASGGRELGNRWAVS